MPMNWEQRSSQPPAPAAAKEHSHSCLHSWEPLQDNWSQNPAKTPHTGQGSTGEKK